MAEAFLAELRPLEHVDKSELLQYWNEFIAHSEREKVLWGFEDVDIDEYYERLKADERNQRFAFLIDGYMVGAVRISSQIDHEANGKIGMSIRPSMRGKHYSVLLLRLARAYCSREGLKDVTGCTDVNNHAALAADRSAGFVETGRYFDWLPNPYPRKAVELILPETKSK